MGNILTLLLKTFVQTYADRDTHAHIPLFMLVHTYRYECV